MALKTSFNQLKRLKQAKQETEEPDVIRSRIVNVSELKAGRDIA